MMIVLVIVVVFIVFGLVVKFGLKMIKEVTDVKDGDTSTDLNITTAQEFLPFNDIKNGVIDMGNYNYVGVLDVSSTNYFLRTGKEQDRIEISYTRFLNSLNHRIVIFTQTKEMDYDSFLKNMQLDIEESSKHNEKLGIIAECMHSEMANLPNRIGNSKQKKKYILVPFSGAIDLDNLNESEKEEYSLTELKSRMNIIISGLAPIGLKARALDTKGIVELIYSSYNRDHYSNFEHIFNGEHLSLFVEGDNKAGNMTELEKLDHILYEAQVSIANEIPDKMLYGKENYNEFINVLNQLREDLINDRKTETYNTDNDEIEI